MRYYIDGTKLVANLNKLNNTLNTQAFMKKNEASIQNPTTMQRLYVWKDYMGNDQFLPSYNIQLGICDDYISGFDVKQYISDTDC